MDKALEKYIIYLCIKIMRINGPIRKESLFEEGVFGRN